MAEKVIGHSKRAWRLRAVPVGAILLANASLIATPSLVATPCLVTTPALAAGDRSNAAIQPQTRLGARQAASLERHIAILHSELRITAAQEPLWQPLAAAMRNGVIQIDHVYARRERQGSMSAVDDLKSYVIVQQTRAQTVESLVEPFQTLYAGFTAAQRRQADETFREFIDNAVRSAR